jgi:hypothetical protein
MSFEKKICAGANMTYSQTELLFILKQYLALKSFAADGEALDNVYPGKKLPNKIGLTVNRSSAGLDLRVLYPRNCCIPN